MLRFGQYGDLLIVLMLMLILIGIHSLATFLFYMRLVWTIAPANPAINLVLRLSDGILVLSIFTTPLAMFFAATNDRLTISIRILATAENGNKFIYAIIYASYRLCALSILSCPSDLTIGLASVRNFVDKYALIDASQYCQLLISLNRFFALSLDGAYFRFTGKWPLVQLLLPWALCFGIKYLQNISLFRNSNIIPLFLMCSLDFVTNWKLKTRRNHGKIAQAETLLMIQMISNSFLILLDTIISYFILYIFNLLFDVNAEIWFATFKEVSKKTLFNLGMSVISIVFLRKRHERSGEISVSATTQTK